MSARGSRARSWAAWAEERGGECGRAGLVGPDSFLFFFSILFLFSLETKNIFYVIFSEKYSLCEVL
jgi:hypothetical protein